MLLDFVEKCHSVIVSCCWLNHFFSTGESHMFQVNVHRPISRRHRWRPGALWPPETLAGPIVSKYRWDKPEVGCVAMQVLNEILCIYKYEPICIYIYNYIYIYIYIYYVMIILNWTIWYHIRFYYIKSYCIVYIYISKFNCQIDYIIKLYYTILNQFILYSLYYIESYNIILYYVMFCTIILNVSFHHFITSYIKLYYIKLRFIMIYHIHMYIYMYIYVHVLLNTLYASVYVHKCIMITLEYAET